MSASPLVARTLTAEEIPALCTVVSRAFQHDATPERNEVVRRQMEPGRTHGVFDGDELIGGGTMLVRRMTLPGTGPHPVAAVSPDRQWLVAGEWGTMSHLQVFPAPVLNPSAPGPGANLPQAGAITLDRPVTNIQGCDFTDATHLMCSSDAATKEVLEVTLDRPLDGKPVTGRVTSAFAIPQRSVCKGTFESEGIDYDAQRGTLRVQMVPPAPCLVTTAVVSYTRGG